MTLIPFNRNVLLCSFALLLVGCEGSHQPLSTDLPIYQTAGKLKLAVAMINHQALPQEPPSLRAPLILTPPQAVQDWANQRLEPAAQDGVAVIILKNYDLREIPATSQSTFLTSWMDTDKERIEGTLEITIEFYDGKGKVIGRESSKVTHGRNFEYDLTPRELEGAWRKEIMLLLDLLDLDLTPRLKPYLVKDKKPPEKKK
jgi:hypothetical protein